MTPLTPAGQALVNRIPHYSRAVIEVERQAVDRALAELRREVEAMFGQVHPMCAIEDEPTDRKAVSRKAVLRLIDKASKPEAGA